LYDLSGKLILSGENQDKMEIQTLPLGPYLLEIKNKTTGEKIVERIIKTN
jgi:hypothetical protein